MPQTRIIAWVLLLLVQVPSPEPADAAAAVDFLATAPTIDGRLDDDLAGLPRRGFPTVLTSDGATGAAAAHYRLAHGADFFYLYAEVEADQAVCRDRAYQNGDGLQLLIARPTADGSPTRDFYVVAVSAVDRPQQEWSRRIIWYHNVDRLFIPLGAGAQVAHQVVDGRLGFEVLLPWAELDPHHLWFGTLGFNLCLVKAVGESDTHTYWVEPDPYLGSENRPRAYVEIEAAAPPPLPAVRAAVQLDRAHLWQGETTQVRVASVGEGEATLELTIRSGEGMVVGHRQHSLLNRQEVPLAVDELPAGGYRVAWQVEGGQDAGELGLTILPRRNPEDLARRIADLPAELAPGTRATLAFRAEDLAARLADLRPHETAARERLDLVRLSDTVAAAAAGHDPVAPLRGHLRRAFRSAHDGTLQPYSLRLPEDLAMAASGSPGSPLLVYLHGSGEDDRVLWRVPDYGGGRLPLIAPLGRGTSHAWSTAAAQVDVAEALADALACYPLDASKVVLVGFSMGGYGVLRTFATTSERYRAVAVFSGHPDLGNRFLGTGEEPDFRDPSNLTAFGDVPVFVHHGRQDRNCPFALAEEMVAALTAAGAEVTFCVDDEGGHEAASARCLQEFQRWLAGVVGTY